MSTIEHFEMDNSGGSDFALLIKNLISSPDTERKAKAAEALTKATIADHGFVTFFKYLNETFPDEIQALEMFCRVVFSRPRMYPDFKSYLMAMRGNFHELMSLLFSQEALFDSLVTKLFYSMRAHGITADFDFFFTEVNDKWLCDVFCNLCGKRFYFDELREVYLKDYRLILKSFHQHKNAKAVECGLHALDVPFEFWTEVLSEDKYSLDYLHSQGPSVLPQSAVEAIVFLALTNTSSTADVSSFMRESFSSEFNESVTEWIKSGQKVNAQVISLLSDKTPSINYPHPEKKKSWTETVIDDLSSTEPAVLAHGLYTIRKTSEPFKTHRTSPHQMDRIAALCAQALFHEDTYVFMNAIKVFHELNDPGIVVVFATCLLVKFKAGKDSTQFPRLVEVFSAWIEDKIFPEDLVQGLMEVTFDMINEHDEPRISALNALNMICMAYPTILLKACDSVFEALKPRSLNLSTGDLEAQALFSFLDSFLSQVSREQVTVSPDIYGSIDELCRKALASPDSSLKVMALNNLMKLERLRRF